MGIAAKLDDLGKPAWIALAVLSFWAWWPLGLATIAFYIWSGRMSCTTRGRFKRWFKDADDMASRAMGGLKGGSSGNRAFDEYRSETLRRLEEEERDFKDFLTRLRMAKDKAEFDQFMADRRRRPEDGQSNAA